VTIRRGPAHTVRQFITATIIAYTIHLRRRAVAKAAAAPRIRRSAHTVRQFIASTIIAYTIHLKRKAIPRVSTAPKVRRRMGYRIFYPIGMPFVRLARAGLRLQRRIAQPKARRRPRILHAMLFAIVRHAIAPRRSFASLRMTIKKRRGRHLWMLLTALARGHRPAMRKQMGTPKSRRRGRHLWSLLTGLARGHRLAMRKQALPPPKSRRSERIKGAIFGPVTGFVRGRQLNSRWRRFLLFWRRPLRRRPPIVAPPLPPLSAPRIYFNATLDATVVFTAPLDQAVRSLSTLDATIVLGVTLP
jgi:hypothetical protein